jgi:Putative zinc-finger
MNCVDVRDRLPEQALGVLEDEQLRQVERHLEWCAGCRKEAAEMLEGLANVAVAMSPVDPHPSLQERVVQAVAVATGRVRAAPGRRGLRLLAVATLAAAISAATAFGWAFAERAKVQGLKEKVATVENSQRGLAKLFNDLKADSGGNGRLYEATLFPGRPAHQQAGQALVYSGPKGRGFVLVEVLLHLDQGHGPYRVTLQERSGTERVVGTLEVTSSGTYVLLRQFSGDERGGTPQLRKLSLLKIVDRTGTPLVVGLIRPYVATPPTPS